MTNKILLKRALMASVLSLICTFVLAQSHSVSGIVTDATREPLVGVSVIIKGTSNGSLTDLDGRYSIKNAPESGTLTASYVGYETAEQVIGNKSTIDFQLSEDVKTLNDIVVIGYGTMKNVLY